MDIVPVMGQGHLFWKYVCLHAQLMMDGSQHFRLIVSSLN